MALRRTLAILCMVCLGGLAGCSDGGGSSAPSPLDNGGTSTAAYLLDDKTRSLIKPAEPNALSDTVIQCTVTLHTDEACTLGQLPLIGMETNDPTVDDIMKRVVVTHDWMGTRFRDLLQIMPHEVLLMMRALTAVVISSEVRPSYYTSHTGAIYLDPQGLWLTSAEEADISTSPDPRTADVQSLDFLILWRYEKDNTDIRAMPRTLDTLKLRMASLLFHELAHANDYFAPTRLDSLNTSVPVYQAAGPNNAIASGGLAATYPLQSTLMHSLAQIAFQHADPTSSLLAVTPDQVANEFPADVANDFYNYSTDREDLAMQFEEVMMLYTLGVARDVAVTNSPADAQSCSEYVVSWGERSRIGEAAVGARSLYAVERLLPEAAAGVSSMLDSLPAPPLMQAGVDWCTNINFGSTSTAAPRALTVPGETSTPVPVSNHVEILRPYL